MKRIVRPKANKYEFDHRHEPEFSVKQGESFVVETEDACNGCIRSADVLPLPENLPYRDATPARANPMAGPVFVEGAQKGDLLAVTIEQIVVDDQGMTAIFPGAGPLADSLRWRTAAQPHTQIIRHLPGPSGTTRDGEGVLNERVRWPLKPFIGTLGVAPEREVETSAVGQGPWGGNLDCREFKEGSTVFLNCYHAGGLLYLGDVHATQGDTEFYGTADETRAEVRLRCAVVKGGKAAFVRVEKPVSIVSVYSYRPLEQAVERAILDLMSWMVQDYGLSGREAYMHTCINPDFRVHVYQMVRLGRIQYTAGAEIPKKYLV